MNKKPLQQDAEQLRCAAEAMRPDQQKLDKCSLRESEDFFRQLFDLHSDVMLLIDHQSGIIVDANPSAAQFYGYPLDVLRGSSVSQINAQTESVIYQQRQKAISESRIYFPLVID